MADPVPPFDPGEEGPGPKEADSPGRRRARTALEWVAVVLGSLAVAVLVRSFLLETFFIPSPSMVPTLAVNDRVLVNKLSYRLHDVNRGDLVVFERPPDASGGAARDLIKRVIALEGETIEGRDGRVVVDGEPLDEPYLEPGEETTGFEPLRVPPDHVFLMGDNRDASRDSRVFGPMAEDAIVGRAFLRVWPPGDVSFL
ncbi:MAG: signal peptidase I [Acidimicrobiales bacterium]